MTTLYFHGLELDIHRTPDLSRAPDGAGMFEIRDAELDDPQEWADFAEEYAAESCLDLTAWVRNHHRSAIEAAYEAEAGL